MSSQLFEADIDREKERLAKENAQRINTILEDCEKRMIFRVEQLDYVDPYLDEKLFDRVHTYSSEQVQDFLAIFESHKKEHRHVPYDFIKVMDQYETKHRIEREPVRQHNEKKKETKSDMDGEDELSVFTDNNSYDGLNSDAPPFSEFGQEDVVEDYDL